ncbi:MAG: ribulose-phosphate 3-epimerase [Nitrososphaerota archaeon]
MDVEFFSSKNSRSKIIIPPPLIVPSILSADFKKLGEAVRQVEEAGADMIHFDIMDGHFVPNISFGPMVVKALRDESSLPFVVHLMVEDPERFIDPVVDAGADMIFFHIEVSPHAWRIIDRIKSRSVKVGVALNPSTPLTTLDYILEEVDGVLIMTVSPGFGGQKLIERMYKKINDLRIKLSSMEIPLTIAVDGGVDFENVGRLIKSGANMLIAGTTIFKHTSIPEAVKKLKTIALQEYSKLQKIGED